MKCPINLIWPQEECGQLSHVIDSQLHEDGRWRRRKCYDGHTFETIETYLYHRRGRKGVALDQDEVQDRGLSAWQAGRAERHRPKKSSPSGGDTE